MTMNKPAAFLICSMVSAIMAGEASAAGEGEGDWRSYSQELNGDVHFFDATRVKKDR